MFCNSEISAGKERPAQGKTGQSLEATVLAAVEHRSKLFSHGALEVRRAQHDHDALPFQTVWVLHDVQANSPRPA
jgi:hypothetical protein